MRIAIFGLGFTGAILARAAKQAGHLVVSFSRDAVTEPDVVCDFAAGPPRTADAVVFDAAVVTAPPQALAAEFWRWLNDLAPRRVLFGTTSSYQRPDHFVNEVTPLVPDHERLPAESAFLAAGGEIFRLAGLYGYERNPLYYIKIGRVGYEDRQVNFIHGDDVARATLALLAAPRQHAVYNLADGQQHSWRQIIDHAVEHGYLQHPRQAIARTRPDASVDPARFLAAFPNFRFTDFWSQLSQLAADARIRA